MLVSTIIPYRCVIVSMIYNTCIQVHFFGLAMSVCSTFALVHVPLILAFFAPIIGQFSVLMRMQCVSCIIIFGFWRYNSAFIASLGVHHLKLFGSTSGWVACVFVRDMRSRWQQQCHYWRANVCNVIIGGSNVCSKCLLISRNAIVMCVHDW